jgi:fructokinase
MRLVGIGEILWDVIGEEEHLGGAVLNFAVHACRLGHEVKLVSAVGKDERGERALQAAAGFGLATDGIQRSGEWPTGIVTVQVDGAGQPAFEIHRPAAYDAVALDAAELARLAAWKPDWICHGTLFPFFPRAKEALFRAVEAVPAARRFYDVNLRKSCYSLELVEELLRRATVVKTNDAEALELGAAFFGAGCTLEAFCREGVTRFGWEAACVTRGDQGCAVWMRGEYVELPGYRVKVADTVGAGDAFSAAFLHGFHAGWTAAECGDFANRLGALVASRTGGVAEWAAEELGGKVPGEQQPAVS